MICGEFGRVLVGVFCANWTGMWHAEGPLVLRMGGLAGCGRMGRGVWTDSCAFSAPPRSSALFGSASFPISLLVRKSL